MEETERDTGERPREKAERKVKRPRKRDLERDRVRQHMPTEDIRYKAKERDIERIEETETETIGKNGGDTEIETGEIIEETGTELIGNNNESETKRDTETEKAVVCENKKENRKDEETCNKEEEKKRDTQEISKTEEKKTVPKSGETDSETDTHTIRKIPDCDVINAAECEFSSTEGPRPQEVPASSTGSEIHTHVEKKPEI